MNRNVLVLIVASVIVLFVTGIGVVVVLFTGEPQNFIPTTCSVTEHSSTTGSFSCPSDASSCVLNISFNCNTQASVPKVIFRTDGDWIAWDVDGDGNLNCFSIRQNPSPSCNLPSINNILLPLTIATYGGNTFYGTTSRIYTKDNPTLKTNYCAKLSLLSGGGCDLSIASTGSAQEITSGAINSYQCSKPYSGSQSGTVVYSGSKAGSSSKSLTLSSGQSISWSDKIEVDVSRTITSQCTSRMPNPSSATSFFECNVDPTTGCGLKASVPTSCPSGMVYDDSVKVCVCTVQCTGRMPNPSSATSYFECNPPNANGCRILASSPTSCPSGQVFDNGKKECVPPYEYSFVLDQSAVTVGNKITGRVVISDSSQVSLIPVKVFIKSIQKGTEQSVEGKTGSDGRYSFSLPVQYDTGTYEVKAVISHPLSTVTTDSIKVFYSETFNIHLYVDNQVQNTGNVLVWAVVSNNLGKAKSDVTLTFPGSVCGLTDISSKITYGLDNIKGDGAYYKIIGDINQACLATFLVTAKDSIGFVVGPVSQVVTVETSSIIIKHFNPEDFQTPNEGSYTFEFVILDDKLNPISNPDSVDVEVQDRGGCKTGSFCSSQSSPSYGKDIPKITATPISIGQGKWKFTHNFGYGMNFISITVSAPNLQSHTYSEGFNFWQSDITDPDVCADGSQPPCDTPIPIGWIVIGLAIVFAGMIFFFIVFRGKK